MSEAPRRATVGLLLSHPAHFIAFGAGSGLSPKAPGTVGTLWGWVSFLAIQHVVGTGLHADLIWAAILTIGWLVGCWACTHTARSLRVADPGSVVWDEVWAFWLMLWLISPVDWRGQLLAFITFRFFDAAKPGPVGWADQLFKLKPGQSIGWAQGLGIMFDDLVAALCALLVLALAVAVRQGGVSAGLMG
ncbi:phosphatidylglycerophosphatase A family protein [Aquabacterium sp.]|uniref:phosphatidylglycerophosphatase A family protein n=1 Tax=Aquabacterium sp. TaxID=1872578 RepID=UPI0040383B95